MILIKIVFLHQFVAENFVSYYCYSKPHVKKNKNYEVYNDNNNNNNHSKGTNNNNLSNILHVENEGIVNINLNFKDYNYEVKENKKHYFQVEKSV